MKNPYECLDLDVVRFDAEDVLTTSGGSTCECDGDGEFCKLVNCQTVCEKVQYDRIPCLPGSFLPGFSVFHHLSVSFA